jgi:TonB family protein
MAHDVFISCTAADKPAGDAITALLETHHIRCWIAPRDILPGIDADTAAREAIAASKLMIVVFRTRVADAAKRDIERAVNAGLPVLPVRDGSEQNAALLKSVTSLLGVPARSQTGLPPAGSFRRGGISPAKQALLALGIVAACLIGAAVLVWQLHMEANSEQARRRATISQPTGETDTAPARGGITAPTSSGKPHVCLEDYPAASVRRGEEGTSVLGFTIAADGTPQDIHIVTSSGSHDLDAAAARCASTWRYRPAMRHGEPVAVHWKAEVRWVLH